MFFRGRRATVVVAESYYYRHVMLRVIHRHSIHNCKVPILAVTRKVPNILPAEASNRKTYKNYEDKDNSYFNYDVYVH